MGKAPEPAKPDKGPDKQDRVKFTGRSAAAQRKRASLRQGPTVGASFSGARLGAWRKQVRKTLEWDKKSLYAIAGVTALFVILCVGMALMVRKDAQEIAATTSQPKPVADGMRVDLSGKMPEGIDEDYLQAREEGMTAQEYQAMQTGMTQADILLEKAESSGSRDEAAQSLASAGFLYEKTQKDYESALDCFERVVSDYGDTVAMGQALSGAVRCARALGDDMRASSVCRRALDAIDSDTPGGAPLCRQIIDCVGEDSTTGRSARERLDEILAKGREES